VKNISRLGANEDVDWLMEFSLVLWWLWKWRNGRVFDKGNFPEHPILFVHA